MKYLLLIVIVLAVLWLARAGRGRAARSKPQGPPPGETMVACVHCGVHLPRSEALPGRGGLYCGEAHRLAHERSPRGS